jgi:hypothetical protein
MKLIFLLISEQISKFYEQTKKNRFLDKILLVVKITTILHIVNRFSLMQNYFRTNSEGNPFRTFHNLNSLFSGNIKDMNLIIYMRLEVNF